MSVRQFLCGFVLATFLSSPAWAVKAIGTFMVVKGKVSVTKANGKKKRAKVGMKIHAKDVIESKKSARAKVVMLDKNVVNISPETKMSFEKYVFEPSGNKKDVLINVLYGKVRNNVKQKYDEEKGQSFRVKTKAAVAGVRGTDFLSGYNRQTKQSKFVTFEGVVEVGNLGAGGKLKNMVRVTPGQITTVAAGGAPHVPRKISNRALASFDRTSGEGAERGESRGPDSVGGGPMMHEGDSYGDEMPGDTPPTGGPEGPKDQPGGPEFCPDCGMPPPPPPERRPTHVPDCFPGCIQDVQKTNLIININN